MKDTFDFDLTGNGKGLVAAVIACIATFLVLLILSWFGFIASADIAYLTIVFSALVAFLVLSDRLSEVSAGGVTVKLREVATDRVDALSITPISDLAFVTKGALASLRDRLSGIRAGDYVALTFQLQQFDEQQELEGQRVHYEVPAVRRHLQAILAATPNAYVIVVNQNGCFIGAIEASRFSYFSDDQLQNFVYALNNGNLRRLLRLQALQRTAASIEIDNKQALDLMVSRRTNFLVLLDEDRRPQKITTRMQVIERLVLALATYSMH